MASAVTVIVMAVLAVIVVAVVAVVMVAIVAVVASMVTAAMSAGELFGGFWKEIRMQCMDARSTDCYWNNEITIQLPSAKTQTAQKRARRKMAFIILRGESQ